MAAVPILSARTIGRVRKLMEGSEYVQRNAAAELARDAKAVTFTAFIEELRLPGRLTVAIFDALSDAWRAEREQPTEEVAA